MKYYILLLFFSTQVFIPQLTSQTIGTTLNTEDALDGYTFFSPFSGTKAYMVDNCGNLINEWDRGTRPGLAAYFLESGLMLRTYKPSPVGPFTSASNSGGIELVDWDNNTVWSYELNTPTQLSHHDAVMMPNGNILMLTWQLIGQAELIALGRDPNEIAPQGFAWNERIIEVEPVGTNEVNIVWEWNIKDHYIQDFDATQANFGVVSEHPELFNINLPELDSPNSHSDLDYNHFNAIDYNEALDQILISVRNSDEIWIIDHSTTTEEAAGHSGGRYGKGGDILYRWGNGSAYERADISEEVLYGQHGAHWIREGADAGKILIFNNGNGRPGPDFSLIEVLNPIQDEDGSYPVPDTEAFGPETSEWIYGDGVGESFYSAFLSNAQRLPNGNTLINSGSPGDIFEIDANKEKVWHYVIPLFGDTPLPQGNDANNNSTFRAYKFPKDFKGFEGIDISPGEPIEINPLPCDVFSSVENKMYADKISVFLKQGRLEISNVLGESLALSIYDMNGALVLEQPLVQGVNSVDVLSKNSGVYILRFVSEDGTSFTKKLPLFY